MPLIPFTDDDVRLNDGGFFSEAQQNRLKPKTDLYIALSVIGAFFGFVISLVFFFVPQNPEDYFPPTLFGITVFGVCFYAVFWSPALAGRVKKGYGVKKNEGFAELSVSYRGKKNDIPVYELEVRNVRFQLNEKTYDAFAEGDYCIYYFRLLQNELLSLETAEQGNRKLAGN